MQEDVATGDLFFSGHFWARGLNITRLNGATGAVVWSTKYDINSDYGFNLTFGLDVARQNEIVLFATFSPYWGSYIDVYRLSKATGDFRTTSRRLYGFVNTS